MNFGVEQNVAMEEVESHHDDDHPHHHHHDHHHPHHHHDQRQGHGDMDLIPSLAAMSIMETTPTLITAEALCQMSHSMQSLAKQGRIYAVQQNGEGRRSARITIGSGNRLYLHQLQEELPPSNACLIAHNNVMRIVNPSFRLAFVEFGSAKESIGTLHIRLLRDSPAAKQFSVLCTGELGPSYANTRLLQLREENGEKEYIVCGDYEENNGTGGQALVRGLGDGEEYNRPWRAGTVWGFILWNPVAAQFCILTKDCPDMVLSAPSYGMVEEGLHHLKAIVHLHCTRNNVEVMNCGLVLDCSI